MRASMLIRILLSHYRQHPIQALFLLTGIVIANVLLVGTLLINAQARSSYAKGENLLRAAPMGELRHRDASRPIREIDYIDLRRQGYHMLAPALRRVVRAEKGEALELLGIDLFAMPRAEGSGRRVGPHEPGSSESGFAEFAFPPYQLWAAPARLQQLGLNQNDRMRLASGELLPPVLGIPGEQLGHRLLMDIGALQLLTRSTGEISSILVFPAPQDRLAALSAALPAHLEFIDRNKAPDPAELTESFHLNLAAMGLLCFVVGVFLIYNAVAFSYTDRRELIRKLRLTGVARRELGWALLLELGLFLLAGSLLGIWLGGLLASWLLPGVGRTLAQLYGVYIQYPDGLAPSGFLLPLMMTALAAALCVLIPLRESLHTPLLKRWQAGWQQHSTKRRDRVFSAIGLLLLAGAWTISNVADNLWLALGGMACLLIGAVLCLPALLRAMLAVLAAVLPARRARLAWLIADSRWLMGPASLALMALTLALVANSGLNTMIGSFRQATDNWLEQRLAADLYLRGDLQMNGLEAWLPEHYSGLSVVERFRTTLNRTTPSGRSASVEVVSRQDSDRFRNSVALIRAEPEAPRKFEAGQGIYISERAWRLDGWQPGALVELCKEREFLPVLGVYHDYGNPKSQWMISQALFGRCWPGQGPSGKAIHGPAGTDWALVRKSLVETFQLEAGRVIDQDELKQIGLAVFDRTFTVTRALNALTLLVAGIGIFCAISAIHHHRIGQQALLASLGMTRRERGVLLLLQWGLLGLLCTVLVAPFGALLAAYLTTIVTPIAFGWSFPLRLEWQHFVVLAALAVLCLALAVILPSFRLLWTSPAVMLRENSI